MLLSPRLHCIRFVLISIFVFVISISHSTLYAQNDNKPKKNSDTTDQFEDLQEQFAKKPTIEKALKLLKEGNEDFYTQDRETINIDVKRLKEISQTNQAKYVFASILSCSDSRVPIELIFDQGPLDLFVVRIAGNVAGVSQLGSIEYGLAHLHTPVLVVLGHEECGAVEATIQAVDLQNLPVKRNIPALIEHIDPAVQRVHQEYPEAKGQELLHYAIEENVYQQIAQIFYLSPITRELAKRKMVRVVGAVYDLKSGRVRWLANTKVDQILDEVMRDPNRVKDIYKIPNIAAPPSYVPQLGDQSSQPQDGTTPMSRVYMKSPNNQNPSANASADFSMRADADFGVNDESSESSKTSSDYSKSKSQYNASPDASASRTSFDEDNLHYGPIFTIVLPVVVLIVVVSLALAIRHMKLRHKHGDTN